MKQRPKQPYKWQKTTAQHVRNKTATNGWFFPQLVILESAYGASRWEWWLHKIATGRLGHDQIPQVDWIDNLQNTNTTRFPDISHETSTPAQTLKQAITFFQTLKSRHGVDTAQVLDFYLYGCGDTTTQRPTLPDEVEVMMYQEGLQILSRMIVHPTDWGQHIQGELSSGNKVTAWFATPSCLSKLMHQLTMNETDYNPIEHTKLFTDADETDPRLKSVHDPCVGTGIMLLHASNYSLALSGQDVDPLMVRWCKLNGYLFVPWMVFGNQRLLRESREELNVAQ